jgi:hypothetical protein
VSPHLDAVRERVWSAGGVVRIAARTRELMVACPDCGREGARLLHILKVPLSRTSVLFQLMRVPLPSVTTPRVLGVDDFALYADVYGTLLMDADTRLPIELWAGRDAEQLAAWLRTHPGVKVVCRDGSLVYRQGITDGAPDAVQVSDRLHLWQGLSGTGPLASTLGGRRAHRDSAAPGDRRQGLLRPLPESQNGHCAAASRSADRHTARTTALAPPGRPVDHHHTVPAWPTCHRGTAAAA